ncbi:hypothetical protein GGI03_007063 [Coemansia sp. RSA 2337]|nr:hypothetical protein GGI09_001328 [Coemansia sp. S100]KAJ2449652.1 hypothetical protein GGI03_007063 [Coemansia sp. RSA 2337]
MDSLSAFQLLPNHVVKLIVDHVAHSSRLQLDGVTTDSEEYKILQMPLLWVCHNFRAFVRERFCRVYRLTLDNDRDRAEALLCSWPTHFEEFDYPTHPLAKELWIHLEIEAVFSGKALQLLSDAPYGACSFPLVRKLCISLTSDMEGFYDRESESDNDWKPEQDNDPEPVLENDWEAECRNDGVPKTRYVYPPDTAANITALVQWIKQMVPAVSEIDVDFHDEPQILHQYSDVHISNLVQQLFGIVERRTVLSDRNDYMLIYLALEPIRDLVHLKCSLDSGFYSAWTLIRHSTKTLQFMDLDVGDTELTDLVIDRTSRGYLEYPCLHTLMIHSHREPCPT